jgi:outer membrane protein assembly factor BamB
MVITLLAMGSVAQVAYAASGGIPLTSPNPKVSGDFGHSVATSDTTVVVGAPFEDVGTKVDAGKAYLFDATTGDLIGTLTSPGPLFEGLFGSSVAISGTAVVVGAPSEDRAYVFDSTSGALITTLSSPNPSGGGFGSSVAISDITVVVGAPYEDDGTNGAAGHAYVFDATTGDRIQTLTSPNPQPSGVFGLSVAVFVDDATVVVGAPGETVGGHAYVFDATSGSLISTLISPSPLAGGGFGSSVAISDTTVVVGAQSEPTGGHVYVFEATTGDLIRTLASPDGQAGGGFGHSLAISDTTVVVGAPGESPGNAFASGRAYVFDASTGSLITTLTSPNTPIDGFFGSSVGVFVDDATVVVGAPGETAGTMIGAGNAYLFL